jgi:hypothetical protein
MLEKEEVSLRMHDCDKLSGERDGWISSWSSEVEFGS